MNHVALHTPSRFLFQERLDHRFDDFRGSFAFPQAANAELGPGFLIQGEGGFDFGDGITVYPYGRRSLYTYALNHFSLSQGRDRNLHLICAGGRGYSDENEEQKEEQTIQPEVVDSIPPTAQNG